MIVNICNKSLCSGCGACEKKCPKNAITMVRDKYGYVFPQILSELCVECGMCIKTCPNNNPVKPCECKNVYAAVSTSTDIKQSSSGGIFCALAKFIIEQGGIVCGAAFVEECLSVKVEHIIIENVEMLYKIAGSKYVESSIINILEPLKKQLDQGRIVLFGGTPCQIAGIKNYLGRNYDNLVTCDLICHGVPNVKMLQDYLSMLTKNRKIIDINFRDKSLNNTVSGFGILKYTYKSRFKTIYRRLFHSQSSYYTLFLNSEIYRDSCYKCLYARPERIGDLTLGDFWGIKNYPNIYEELHSTNGINAVLVNTLKGEKLIEAASAYIKIVPSDFDSVVKNNHQLSLPSKHTDLRCYILELYKSGGWNAIEHWFKFERSKKDLIKTILPSQLYFKWLLKK